VKLLIDTHVLFWWLTDDKQLTTTAGEAIAKPENTVFVSAVSIWEMAIKVKIGKWPEASSLLVNWHAKLTHFGGLLAFKIDPPVLVRSALFSSGERAGDFDGKCNKDTSFSFA